MSKQKNPIRRNCQHVSGCFVNAIIGTYRWEPGETDVNLDRPVLVSCGPHKPRLHRSQNLRNVRIMR